MPSQFEYIETLMTIFVFAVLGAVGLITFFKVRTRREERAQAEQYRQWLKAEQRRLRKEGDQ